MASRFITAEGEATARQIGDRIREARLARGLSQKQLAYALGVSHQAVNKYEQANVDLSIGRLLALAEALGVTPTFLIGDARATRPKESRRRDGPGAIAPSLSASVRAHRSRAVDRG
jgi:transcriptional regulator with XRE-family HTH domain